MQAELLQRECLQRGLLQEESLSGRPLAERAFEEVLYKKAFLPGKRVSFAARALQETQIFFLKQKSRVLDGKVFRRGEFQTCQIRIMTRQGKDTPESDAGSGSSSLSQSRTLPLLGPSQPILFR